MAVRSVLQRGSWGFGGLSCPSQVTLSGDRSLLRELGEGLALRLGGSAGQAPIVGLGVVITDLNQTAGHSGVNAIFPALPEGPGFPETSLEKPRAGETGTRPAGQGCANLHGCKGRGYVNMGSGTLESGHHENLCRCTHELTHVQALLPQHALDL